MSLRFRGLPGLGGPVESKLKQVASVIGGRCDSSDRIAVMKYIAQFPQALGWKYRVTVKQDEVRLVTSPVRPR